MSFLIQAEDLCVTKHKKNILENTTVHVRKNIIPPRIPRAVPRVLSCYVQGASAPRPPRPLALVRTVPPRGSRRVGLGAPRVTQGV